MRPPRTRVPGPGLDPAHLVFLIIALNAWWFSAPQLARILPRMD